MKLFFRKTGEGIPLIILHGLFGMNDNWASLAKLYANEGYAVYLPDLRNHGQSPHADEFTYEAMAADLLEFMNDENISQAYIVGHSMGGKVAMFFSCLSPERVKKLVVVDISTRYYTPHHQEVIAGLHATDLQNTTSRGDAEKQMAVKIPDAGVRQFLLKNLYWKESPSGDKVLSWRFNLPIIEKDIEQVGMALPEKYFFDGPALFIRGEQSKYITREDESNIAHHFPKATIETIPKAGHWVHADNPSAFSESLLRFLKSED